MIKRKGEIINYGEFLGEGSWRKTYKIDDRAYKIEKYNDGMNREEYDRYIDMSNRYDDIVVKIFSISEDDQILECELVEPLYDYILNKTNCDSENLWDDFSDLDIYEIIDKYLDTEKLNYSQLYNMIREYNLDTREIEYAMNWGVDKNGSLKCLDYAS